MTCVSHLCCDGKRLSYDVNILFDDIPTKNLSPRVQPQESSLDSLVPQETGGGEILKIFILYNILTAHAVVDPLLTRSLLLLSKD